MSDADLRDSIYRHDPFFDETGRELYGGFRATDDQPVGATSVYLSPQFIDACPEKTMSVFAIGTGGRVGAAELAYAKTLGLQITTINARDLNGEL